MKGLLVIHQSLVLVLVAAALISCDVADESTTTAIQKQTGRFTVVTAQDGYPPIILDTAAGCVMTLAKNDDGTVFVDEVLFPGGTNSCNASKQLLVVDTATTKK